MPEEDKAVYGVNGPGDIETIIAEIEAETASAQQRLSKLKRAALDFHEALMQPYQPAQAESKAAQGPKFPLAPAPAGPIKGRPDKD